MNDVIEMNSTPHSSSVAVAAPATPADIVLYAMQKGADIAQIEKFMDLQMKWEADQARKAFVSDMAEFKKNPPKITKDKQVAFNGTSYMHATLGNVTGAIVEGLARHGFSHRWDTEQQQGGQIVVTCILTHKQGHSERTTLSAGRDDSGKKNNIQQMASTVTYLQRYTLLSATGVATNDQEDDDGAGSEPAVETKPVQRMTINGKRFENALLAVKNDSYSPADIRKNFALTVDQETALADAEKELVAA
jgi:hypothetical protein